MPTYLDAIVGRHRDEAAQRTAELGALRAAAEAAPPPRDFEGALAAGFTRDGIAVVAEIKRRTPSKGPLAAAIDPAAVAADYERGGAACLSVLTDGPDFGGSPEDLEIARKACGLPVLRKDFTVAGLDLYEARAMGSDAALLIVAALDDSELRDLFGLGTALGLALVVEVHDEGELARALRVGARLIGVNQRDLHSFAVDTERARRVARRIPEGLIAVAESGIAGRSEVVALAEAGFHAVLVGEALVSATDRAAAVEALRTGRDDPVAG